MTAHAQLKLPEGSFSGTRPILSPSGGSLSQRRHGQRLRAVCAASRQEGYRVLITGSTKGLGKALAESFVRNGDSVVITSRTDNQVQATVRRLDELKRSGATVKGTACNVSKPADVKALAAFALDQLGGVDLWINNAGTNSYKYDALSDLDDQDIVNIVETNVLGVMLCCREAIRMMRSQPGVGHVFNMDGAGADGNATPRFAAYGATKRSLAQLGKSLQAELKMKGVKNVCVHNISPGMVTTELLMSGGDTQAAKFFINCLAEEPETVAAFLVPRMRQVAASMAAPGSLKPTYIRFLTKGKAYGQIILRLLLGRRRDRYIKES